MRRGGRTSTTVGIALLLVLLQPAYANGEHVHVGGLFLVLLGGVVFLGSFVVIFYFLLRATPEEEHEEQESEE
jgi:heme/copper-type cytochrome/quinol oxidase subunit 2